MKVMLRMWFPIPIIQNKFISNSIEFEEESRRIVAAELLAMYKSFFTKNVYEEMMAETNDCLENFHGNDDIGGMNE